MPIDAIQVRQLGKRYRLYASGDAPEYQMLSERLTGWLKTPWRMVRGTHTRPRKEWFWALRDVDFRVADGEVIGVIGRNGAGKSTLLKILSRITRPTTGECDLNGRVGSLLEVGTGFHPELSGRENIFLNGAVLGMSRREIQRQFDAIIDFAGVERFLDTPVKRYSSGMRVRLAFAVAAHLEPEILVVDEVLAVGDLAFQKKCLARMGEVATEGRTVVFVSHDMPAIESLCTRALLMADGGVVADGDTHEIVQQYVQSMIGGGVASESAQVDLAKHPNRRSGSSPYLTSMILRNSRGQRVTEYSIGESIDFEIGYVNPDRRRELGFALFLCSQSGQRLAMLHSRVHSRLDPGSGEVGTVSCHLPDIAWLPGNYRIDVGLGTWDELIDYVEHATSISVIPADYLGTGELPNAKQGVMAVRCCWDRGETSRPRMPIGVAASGVDAGSSMAGMNQVGANG